RQVIFGGGHILSTEKRIEQQPFIGLIEAQTDIFIGNALPCKWQRQQGFPSTFLELIRCAELRVVPFPMQVVISTSCIGELIAGWLRKAKLRQELLPLV